jgi:hypothetical protein
MITKAFTQELGGKVFMITALVAVGSPEPSYTRAI